MQPMPSPQTHLNNLSHRLMLTAGLVAAAGFAFVSMAANLRFGISLASKPFDQTIYGTLSVAADLMKIALPLAVMILWRKGERIFAIAGAVFWIGAIVFSLSAALGFAASTRNQTIASNENLIENRKGWEAKIIRIEQRLDRLGTPRPANVIAAEIDGLLRTQGSEGYETINGPITQEICPKVDRLRKELAASKEAARLEADLVADRRALSTMPETASVADPQSTALMRLTGADEDSIRSGIATLIAFLVEFGSALGFTLIILAFRRSAPKRQAVSLDKQQSPTVYTQSQPQQRKTFLFEIAKAPEDLVTRWALDRLDIVSSGSIQADDAFKDFREWCCVSGGSAPPFLLDRDPGFHTRCRSGNGGTVGRTSRAPYGVHLRA